MMTRSLNTSLNTLKYIFLLLNNNVYFNVLYYLSITYLIDLSMESFLYFLYLNFLGDRIFWKALTILKK